MTTFFIYKQRKNKLFSLLTPKLSSHQGSNKHKHVSVMLLVLTTLESFFCWFVAMLQNKWTTLQGTNPK